MNNIITENMLDHEDLNALNSKEYLGEKFSITCNECGSKNVTFTDSRGWSCGTGGWGSLDIECVDCNASHMIVDNG